MKIILIISLALLTIPPILGQENLDLRSDGLISKTFSEKEIQGLESMVRYVDNLVTKGKNQPDINNAYHLFFEKIAQSTEYNVPIKETEKYQFLKNLDSVQFSVVWRFVTDINMLSIRDTVYRNLDNFPQLVIKPFSIYMDYLEEVGKEDSYFNVLQKNFEAAGGFSAGDAYWFPRNHSAFDFTVPKNRLWAVIFILRMEETYEMKLDRYLANKK
ncbi:hypothetical protein HCG49_01570 [Arenibacter sp. 6A1]|uniref:hypothetical protein n=1 Tax=Arenibacter sp. 6A1 TaxID=2720391 RepID=UPI0014461556|nr:hypothetical protein [Arenibacter sp. 6A1]NKI25248.1 hypothetical protein [Arenibacter sp. 6A1]